jgi:hypothetical protein
MFSRVMHPCQRPPVTLHGVVFDILVGSENRVGNYGFSALIFQTAFNAPAHVCKSCARPSAWKESQNQPFYW